MRYAHWLMFFCLIALVGCQSAISGLSATSSAAMQTPTDNPIFKSTTSNPNPKLETPMPATAPVITDAFEMNARIGRGINLGNALEAPNEGEWGVTLKAEYFRLIKEQGFRSVRVPIRWSAHAQEQAPYTIDPQFFERIDWVVEQATQNDLTVILNIHHYDALFEQPKAQTERFLAIWDQIAKHYRNAPQTVLFELLNEPNGSEMSAGVWNDLLVKGLKTVRATNPDRFVIIGPVEWNSVDKLDTLLLPKDDRRLIATFHYYQPFHFTHQGAEWQTGSDKWLGTKWQATAAEKAAISRDLDKARYWSEQNQRPVFLGEFGAYSKADMDSRARWTEYVAREAEARGFSWAYWEFCAGFGIYDPSNKVFYQPLVEALVPPQ